MPAKTARKRTAPTPVLKVVPPGSVSATDARDQLGALLDRAHFKNERIAITERGADKAFLIGPEDMRRLEQLHPSAVPTPELQSAEAGASKA